MSEYQHSPFSSTKALNVETLLGNLGLALRDNMIDVSVGMTWIVMEEHQTFGMCLLRNLQGIEVRRMSPTNARRSVFLGRVLGILDEEISIVYQRHVAGRFHEVPRRRRFTKGFVIGRVRQHVPIGSETIAQGAARMIEHPGFHGRRHWAVPPHSVPRALRTRSSPPWHA